MAILTPLATRSLRSKLRLAKATKVTQLPSTLLKHYVGTRCWEKLREKAFACEGEFPHFTYTREKVTCNACKKELRSQLRSH